jgi:hypothetical protein
MKGITLLVLAFGVFCRNADASIDGATHMDLFDGKGVDLAMNKLAPFFNRSL